jgi:hypothetical protein
MDSQNKNKIDKLSRDADVARLLKKGSEVAEEGQWVAKEIDRLLAKHKSLIEELRWINEQILELRKKSPSAKDA